MNMREFGKTGLKVSPLGFGGGHIGGNDHSELDIEKLVNGLLDLGINLFDTARGYGESEVRLGQSLKSRRAEAVISTKIGYGVPGFSDWTSACITAGVDQALRLLQTDYIDIVHLHSCPLETLQAGDVILALQAAVQSGKVRVMAYSGENEPLAWAIDSGYFGSIQTSVNLCDPYSLLNLLPKAQELGLGVIAKRALANAFWRFERQPQGDYAETYWLRWQEMGLSSDLPMPELAVRFSAFAPGVSTAIVGSRQLDHIAELKQQVDKGPLEASILTTLNDAYAHVGMHWRGEI
jgi:aryl-alcohol dehydrogenase-like predicted oxidoreductase